MPSTSAPMISVVFGSYNRQAFLRSTLESVRKEAKNFLHEIIVVDGGSTDGSLQYLASQKDVVTIVQHNHGKFRSQKIRRRSWGYFMNLGFKAAQGKYILMISDDCLLVAGAVNHGVAYFEELLTKGRKIGAMAFYWRNWPEQETYWVGLTLGNKMFVNHGLYLRSALEEVGWIDEDRYQFYHADGDLCLKLWHNGYEVVDGPKSFVEHFMHANLKVRRNNMSTQENDWKAYLERWTKIYYDPTKDNSDGWMYQSYDDPTLTSRSFPWVARMLAILQLFVWKIWKKHIRPVLMAKFK